MMVADPTTAPHDDGVLVIDDSGNRNAGTKTAPAAVHSGHGSPLDWGTSARLQQGRGARSVAVVVAAAQIA